MATRQKLIHLHSAEALSVAKANAVNMAVGEIAVQAADKTDSSLWILTSDGKQVVQFPSVAKVESLITGKTSTEISGLKSSVSDLQTTLTGYDKEHKVADAISAATNSLQGQIDTIDGLIGDGFSSGSTIASQLAAVKTTADAASGKADANATAISTINNALGSLTDANAVPNAIAAAKTKVARSTDTVTTKFLTVTDNSGTNPADGVTYTLTLTDVASAKGLSDLKATVDGNKSNIETLLVLHAAGSHNGYSTVAEEVNARVAEVINGAPEAFDTLKEIADWIGTDTTGAAQMATDITDLKATLTGYTKTDTVQKAISTVNSNITTINSVLKGLSGESAVSNAINAAKTTITTGETGGVKVEIDNTGISNGHTNYKISGVGLATTGAVSDLSKKVGTLETSLANEVTARTEAVKTITDTIGEGFNTSTATVAKKVAAAKTTITTANTGFIRIASSTDTGDSHVNYTITTNDIASANALSTLDTAAVKSGKIVSVDGQEIAGTVTKNELKFDLSTMIIDCGEY